MKIVRNVMFLFFLTSVTSVTVLGYEFDLCEDYWFDDTQNVGYLAVCPCSGSPSDCSDYTNSGAYCADEAAQCEDFCDTYYCGVFSGYPQCNGSLTGGDVVCECYPLVEPGVC
jgi:hypothetical protein